MFPRWPSDKIYSHKVFCSYLTKHELRRRIEKGRKVNDDRHLTSKYLSSLNRCDNNSFNPNFLTLSLPENRKQNFSLPSFAVLVCWHGDHSFTDESTKVQQVWKIAKSMSKDLFRQTLSDHRGERSVVLVEKFPTAKKSASLSTAMFYGRTHMAFQLKSRNMSRTPLKEDTISIVFKL